MCEDTFKYNSSKYFHFASRARGKYYLQTRSIDEGPTYPYPHDLYQSIGQSSTNLSGDTTQITRVNDSDVTQDTTLTKKPANIQSQDTNQAISSLPNWSEHITQGTRPTDHDINQVTSSTNHEDINQTIDSTAESHATSEINMSTDQFNITQHINTNNGPGDINQPIKNLSNVSLLKGHPVSPIFVLCNILYIIFV